MPCLTSPGCNNSGKGLFVFALRVKRSRQNWRLFRLFRRICLCDYVVCRHLSPRILILCLKLTHYGLLFIYPRHLIILLLFSNCCLLVCICSDGHSWPRYFTSFYLFRHQSGVWKVIKKEHKIWRPILHLVVNKRLCAVCLERKIRRRTFRWVPTA